MSEFQSIVFPPRHADFCIATRAGAVDLDLRATIDARHFGEVAETLHRIADHLAVAHGAAVRSKHLTDAERLDCAIFLRESMAIVTPTCVEMSADNQIPA